MVLGVQPRHEPVKFLFTTQPHCDDVINVPLPYSRVDVPGTMKKDGLFKPSHEDVGDGGCHRCSHGSAEHLLEDVIIELEDIVLQHMVDNFQEKVCGRGFGDQMSFTRQRFRHRNGNFGVRNVSVQTYYVDGDQQCLRW
jgi:hypothetical protein